MIIPKIIHYCWFGGNPLPASSTKCINSWKKYFPDYEIIEWNESNYNVNIIPFTSDANKEKKYAFLSDFARFDILYKNGGIYFDTDVEVIKSFDNILFNSSFLGMETSGRINPGLGCAFYSKHPVIFEIINIYNELNYYEFIKSNKTIVDITTDIFKIKGFINNNYIQKICDITIYPSEYFNPIDYDTHYLHKTDKTYSIHYGESSWTDRNRKFTAYIHKLLCRLFGKKIGAFLSGKFRKFAKFIFNLLKK